MEGETKFVSPPERRLYGRLVECQMLNARYRMAVLPPFLSRKQNVVLISGDAGMGKCALASSLRGAVEKDGGLFLSGKFDQFLGQPFEPFRQAFTEYTDLICQRYPERIGQLRADILKVVGREVELLTSTIPALTRIIGQQKGAAKVPGSSTSHRFRYVFRAFLRAICNEKWPLVLQFDDIQWADASSLELLRYMSTSSGDKAFFLVCTFRRETSLDSRRPFVEALQDMKADTNLEVTQIRLQPLKLVNVDEMVSDALVLTKHETLPLSNIIFRQSRGNSLYVSEVLNLLVDQELVYMEGDKWNWCIDKIQAKLGGTNSIVDLVATKMKTMPSDVQELLKAASCLGQMIDQSSLFITLQKEPSQVIDSINLSIAAGMLVSIPTVGKYSFPHEKIQEAASSLITNEEKSEYFIMLGRRLWRGSDEGTLHSNIFTIVNLLYFGIDLITDTNERYELAELHHLAGEKATALTAFSQAASYLRRGIKLLGKNSWTEKYALTLALYDSLAEVEASNADYDRVKMLVDDVHKNACNIDDKIRSYFTLIHSMASEDYVTEAITCGIDFLRELGEPFPLSISKSQINKELMMTQWALRGKSNCDLLSLQHIVDGRQIACAKLMSVLFVYSYVQRSPHAPILACRAIRHTLKHGLFAGSASTFASYGTLLMSTFDYPNSGKSLSILAHSLLELDKEKEYLAQSKLLVIVGIDSFFKPMSEVTESLKYASRIALGRGDIAMAGLNAMYLPLLGFLGGMRIPVLENEAARSFALLNEYNQHDKIPLVHVIQAYVAKLTSVAESNCPTVLDGPFLLVNRSMQEAEERKNFKMQILIQEAGGILAYMFLDFEASRDYLKTFFDMCLQHKTKVLMSYVVMSFYQALNYIALARKEPLLRERRKMLKQADNLAKSLTFWARYSPTVYSHRSDLITAELRATRNPKDQMITRLYECAIQGGANAGFYNEAAMASERACEHFQRVGDSASCLHYSKQAMDLYQEYGAISKVARMVTQSTWQVRVQKNV